MTAALTPQELENLWLSDFGGRYPNNFSYFSGSQVFIFAGDLFLDEAVFLSYNLRQNRRPIYGYASAYWDALAVGTVLVEGSLALNYVDNKYLSILLYDNARRRLADQPERPPRLDKLSDPMSYLSALSGYNLMTREGQQAFQAAADTLRRRFWSKESTARIMPRADQFPPVDVYLTYGGRTGALGGTTKKLEQVAFVGESQTIEVGGQPILEVYSFIARRVLNILEGDVPSQAVKP